MKITLALCLLALPLVAQEEVNSTKIPAGREMGLAKPLEINAQFETYGRELRWQPVVDLATVMAHPTAYHGANVEIRGTVKEVCLAKGCWVILQSGKHEMRVKFKDYAFFMPLDIAGRHVTFEGQLNVSKVTEDERRHYAEDAGQSADEIAKIKGDVTEIGLMAEAARIGLPRAHEPEPGISKSLGKTAAGFTMYGGLPRGLKTMTLEQVMKNAKALDGVELAIEGWASGICVKKGCWMFLQWGEHEMRVKFKDYGFFMPIDGKGRWVRAEGKVVVSVETEEDRKHYAEDEGLSQEQIDKIKGDLVTVGFIADAVQMGPAAR